MPRPQGLCQTPQFCTHNRIAAADTTAVSLTFTIYHCLANPLAWERLRDDIRGKFSNANKITGQSTASLEYLDAVIHEGMAVPSNTYIGTRLRPAAASNLIRDTPAEGMVIDGHFIPGKVSLLEMNTHVTKVRAISHYCRSRTTEIKLDP